MMSARSHRKAGVRLLNQPIALGCDAIADAPWTAPAKVDDRTVDYLLSVRREFKTLGDVARGLAALWPQPIDSAA
jgi:hypothetical protein